MAESLENGQPLGIWETPPNSGTSTTVCIDHRMNERREGALLVRVIGQVDQFDGHTDKWPVPRSVTHAARSRYAFWRL